MKSMIDSIASSASALAAQGQAAVAAKAQASSQGAATQSAAARADTAATQASAEQVAAVTVELSDQAQAKALKIEGMSVSEIATKLGTDVDTVNSYLNIVS
jgi:DNA-directed RNA polymerase specialized sigma24 family protein